MKTHLKLYWSVLLAVGLYSVPVAAQNTNLIFSWTVNGTGTETWYTDDLVYQSKTISISMPSNTPTGYVDGCDSVFWTPTAPISGTATFQYVLNFASYGGVGGGSANVYIRDQTTGTDIFFDETSTLGTVHNGSFPVIAGHTYVFTAHACGHKLTVYSGFHGYGFSEITAQMPDHYQHNSHTATRSATATATNFVTTMTTGKDLGGFSASPQPQNSGTISGVSYKLAGNNTNVVLFFSDTRTTNTTNPNASIVAAWVPVLQNLAVTTLTPTNIVFQVSPGFTTNYSVGGYYVANGVTNNFGTGSGPSTWGIGSLTPNTAYSFYLWGSDLVNNFSGPTIRTNVTTPPLPVLPGLWIASVTPSNVVFQIPQALSTNYSVGGYFIANNVTNAFGTGPGPSIWGVGPLNPNTAYTFILWQRDLVNNMSSATITTNVSTLPMPGYNQVAAKPLGGGKVQLSFVGNAGAKYALERSVSLWPANWVPQATNIADSIGVLAFTNTPNGATNNFWRIRLVP